jgi:hypothetical protein
LQDNIIRKNMKKLILLISLVLSVFLVKAQTQTYLINQSDLFNMTGLCGTNNAYYISGAGTTGFNWTDNLPAGSTVNNVTVEVNIGIECAAGTRTTSLNGGSEPSFTTVADCACNPTGVNGIKNLTLNPSNYIVNGTNQFRIVAANSFGLMPSATLSNSFARVTVSYTIGSDYVIVTSPNGGENWAGNSTQNITWNTVGTIPTVNLQYSTDGGSGWTNIVSGISNTGTYSWTVPNINTTQARVRVQNAANTSVSDISNANFTINQQLTLTITSPNGGESWNGNSNQSINWTTGGSIPNVNLQYSTDGGTNWISIVNNISNTGTYAWTVPNIASTQTRVRVQNAANTSIFDISNANFTINFVNPLTITSPNGGENWTGYSNQNITWTTSGSIPNVNLEYSTNGGSNWIAIISNLVNNGTYSWSVPNIATNNSCRVRVLNSSNTSVNDASNANFTITQSSSLLHTYCVQLSDLVNLATTCGSTGLRYRNNAGTSGFNWTDNNIPAGSTIDGVNIKFNVIECNGSAGQVSSSTTTLNSVAQSSFSATYECACDNSNTINPTINVNANPANYVVGGVNQFRFTNLNTFGLYPTSAIGNCYAQVNVYYTPASDYVVITSPNGGETWVGNSTQNITWNTVGTIPTVNLQYSNDGGSGWTNIVSGISNTGTYSWTVPNITTTQARVRVQNAANTSVSDISNANFTINQQLTLTITSPNGGESWNGNSNQSINWTTGGSIPNVNLQYSTDGGTNWISIVNNISNTGTYAWTVPNITSTQTRVRVQNAANTSIFDISNANFTINFVNPLTITSPNGGENWTGYSNQNITWTTSGSIPNVNLEYSTNGGSNWIAIISNLVNNGTYSWSVPNIATNNSCRVRVFNSSNTSVNDASNANFTITQSSSLLHTYCVQLGDLVNLASTCGTTGLRYRNNAGTSGFNWTDNSIPAGSTIDGVNIKFNVIECNGSAGQVSSSTTILNSLAQSSFSATYECACDNSNTINPTINVNPNPANYIVGGVNQFRFTNLNTFGLYPTSAIGNCYAQVNVYYTPATDYLVVTSPNGGETWVGSTTQNITWNTVGTIPNVNLQYSTDGGSGWTNIVSGISNTGTYSWTVPSINTTQASVRVQNAANTSVSDISNANFTISNQSLTLTSPNGGENLSGGNTHNITWTYTGSFQYVKFEYSTNNGTNWTNCTNGSGQNWANTADLTYAWSVPSVNSSTCLIRISEYYTNVPVDLSNNLFTITSTTATLTLTSPNGGQNYNSGSTQNITWTNTGTINFVNLQYSTNGGSSWNSIVNGITNTGTYAWTIPCLATSSSCRVRVLNYNDTSINDASDANFTITNNAALTVTAPNGGENWTVGTNQNITWTTTGGCIDYVNLQYSLDGGTNWSSITSGITNTGTYTWNVPSVNTSTTCRVRVQDYYNPSSIFDISNANFTITNNNTITLTSPNGGETLTSGSTHNVTWTYTGSFQYVKFEYSTNGGANWTACSNGSGQNWANTVDMTYAWVVPSVSSTNCLVRVSEYYNSVPSDISNAVFTINNNQSITVTSPNGGENWNTGSNYSITWTNTGTINFVNIQYSTNAGSNWNTIVNGITNTGSYNWTIPNINTSTNCLIRVQNYNSTTINDISNAVFTITSTPTITVTSPNGGEVWTVGSGRYIYWNSTGINNISLEYSTNAGTSWATIVGSTSASLGYYYWTVPNTPSNQCRVRATDLISGTSDISNANFTIVAPTITVGSPNGGEIWTGLETRNISWTSSNASNYARVELTTNLGTTWTVLSNAVYYVNSGSLNITVPNVNSNQCRVRVSDYYNNTITDQSDAVFSIQKATPTLTVNSPNGGETFPIGSAQYITWTSVSVDNVNIEYSTDGGTDWSAIANNVNANTGYFYWTVPNTPSTNCLVRVSETSTGNPIDQSNAVFTIAQPVITVVTPNGGETLTGLTNYNITWTSSSISNYVRIWYSTNNGTNWSTVTSYTFNDGSHTWSVPNVASANCKIRIQDYYTSSILDESDAVFTINQAPASLTLTSPNGGENWVINNGYYIYWNAVSIANVSLEYTTNDGASWNTITSSTAANLGYYYWTVPNTPSSNCYVRVTDVANASNTDTSNDNFAIVSPVITVTSPNGGESFTGLTNQNITWTSSNASNYVNIQYSTNNGSSWNTVVNAKFNNGTYNWYVPNVSTSNALVRVQDYYNANISDVSNATFTINQAAAAITVTSPNTNVSWAVGSSYYITWNATSVSTVNIEYSIDGGSSYNQIASNVNAAGGTYYWTVPNTPSTTCRVRVIDASNSSIGDISNVNFTIIAPSITVTAPNGGQIFEAFTTTSITWTSNLSNYVRIQYSTNNGTSWNTISNAVYFSGANGSYNWYVPNTPSNACRVRVSDYYNSAVLDESDNVFEILAPSASVTLISPNGGNVWASGSTYNITWTSISISNVGLSYSIDNGASWTTIITSTNASTGSYAWTVPNTPSTQCLVKVSNADSGTNGLPFDDSNANFTITTPFITVTSPNGGQTWTVGDYKYITWNSAGVGNVKVDYSTNNGTDWVEIINSTTNFGYYYWLVPNTPSLSCKVRVSDVNNGAVTDMTDLTFAILTPTPSITVTSPNGGQNWIVGNNYYITWTSTAVSTVKIEYTADNGLSWNTLANNFSNIGYYLWTIPNNVSENCWVRVSSATNSAVTDMSNAQFAIVPNTPSISIISPNANAQWCQNSYRYISWSSVSVGTVDIEISTNGGSNWSSLASGYNNIGYIYALMPNTTSTNMYVRITDASNSSVNATSQVFELISCTASSNVIITDSVDTEICKGDSVKVSFTKVGTFAASNTYLVQLSDSVGNFANATFIGSLQSSEPDTIMAYIPVDVKSSNGYRIRVISDNPAVIGSDNGDNISILGSDFTFSANEVLKYLPDGMVKFSFEGDTNNIESYAWSFGDGDSSFVRNPTHNYSAVGYFDVSLTVTNTNGCAVTKIEQFYIRVERVLNNTTLVTNTSANVNAVAFANNTTGCIALSDGNCLVTTDGGTTWVESNTGAGGPLRGASLTNGNWVVCGADGFISSSTNQGATWNNYNVPTNANITSVTMTSATSGFATDEDGNLLTFDGTSWTAFSTGASTPFYSVSAKGNYAYASGANGSVYRYNNGTWTPLTTNSDATLRSIQFVDSTKGYAVAENGLVLRTTDKGDTWETVLSGLDIDFTTVMATGQDSAIAAGKEGILYFTKDGGNMWERYSIGDLTDLEGSNFRGGKGYVSGNAGTLRMIGTDSESSTGVDNPIINTVETKLTVGVYPNPTLGNINLVLETESNTNLHVNLKDVHGRTLMEVTNQKSNGIYATEVNLSDLPAGVYFFHIRNEDRSIVKRIVKQ